jgi:hypothetical protein
LIDETEESLAAVLLMVGDATALLTLVVVAALSGDVAVVDTEGLVVRVLEEGGVV